MNTVSFVDVETADKV